MKAMSEAPSLETRLRRIVQCEEADCSEPATVVHVWLEGSPDMYCAGHSAEHEPDGGRRPIEEHWTYGPIKEAAETIVSLHQQLAQQGWQPMDTAPRDGTPFLVTWAPSRMGGPRGCVEMVGGWHEYEECRSYGEPEAYGWHPLPRALASPMTAATDQESGR
jgi:hypothetical protein